MTSYNYTVVIERGEDGYYVGHVPYLPGCFTQGRNLEETRANMAEAIQCHIEGLMIDGEAIPVEPEDRSSVVATVDRLAVAV